MKQLICDKQQVETFAGHDQAVVIVLNKIKKKKKHAKEKNDKQIWQFHNVLRLFCSKRSS